MAVEFNKENIRRRGGLQSTAKSVAIRWSDLRPMKRDRQKELSEAEKSEPIDFKRSA